MQILSTWGEEGNLTEGLNIIEGNVKKLKLQKLRLPHIGWNNLKISNSDKLLSNITNDETFYFLHSYFFAPKFKKNSIALTSYEEEFTSIIKNKNFYGIQFHPEKSQTSGLKLIQNFLNLK